MNEMNTTSQPLDILKVSEKLHENSFLQLNLKSNKNLCCSVYSLNLKRNDCAIHVSKIFI